MGVPTEKEFGRHKFWYTLCRHISPFLLRKYSYKTDVLDHFDEPTIVLSNHLTESDLFMLIRAFREHMYFVCGEHLLRSKIGFFLCYIGGPIPAPRGNSKLETVVQILQRVKQGHSIALFPEGCRSFDGETLPISLSTAKLIKKSSAALITYKIHGGYFIAPRWAYHFRKGHAEGEIIRKYSSDEIRSMRLDELSENINRDLYENAYTYQKEAKHRYKSRHLTEGLENYLEICPQCGSYDTMVTQKNQFRCSSCGLSGTMDEYGMLHGANLPFNTVYDWSKWMETKFSDDLQTGQAEILFTENDILLYEILPKHKTNSIAKGKLLIRKNYMEFLAPDETKIYLYPFSEISDKSLLYYGKTLLFTVPSGYFGITGETFHAWKLDRLIDAFQKK